HVRSRGSAAHMLPYADGLNLAGWFHVGFFGVLLNIVRHNSSGMPRTCSGVGHAGFYIGIALATGCPGLAPGCFTLASTLGGRPSRKSDAPDLLRGLHCWLFGAEPDGGLYRKELPNPFQRRYLA